MRDLQASPRPRRGDSDRTELESPGATAEWGLWGTAVPPLIAVPSQVLWDYLQGKLLVSPQEDTLLARLAALQHRSKAQEDHLSE